MDGLNALAAWDDEGGESDPWVNAAGFWRRLIVDGQAPGTGELHGGSVRGRAPIHWPPWQRGSALKSRGSRRYAQCSVASAIPRVFGPVELIIAEANARDLNPLRPTARELSTQSLRVL